MTKSYQQGAFQAPLIFFWCSHNIVPQRRWSEHQTGDTEGSGATFCELPPGCQWARGNGQVSSGSHVPGQLQVSSPTFSYLIHTTTSLCCHTYPHFRDEAIEAPRGGHAVKL